MTVPTLRVYVDWDGLASSTHDFTADSRADMSGKVAEPFTIERGRSLDFGSDAKGRCAFRIPVGRVDASYARTVLATSGLVGYWPLGEASGTVVNDIAGVDVGSYVATPTLGATGPLTGDTSTGVTLNGSTQYATVPDSTTLDLGDGPFTIAAWVKRSSTGTEDAIVGKGTGAFYLYLGSDDKLYLAKTGTGAVASTTVTVTDTSWHLVVATYAGTTTGKLYIDAVDRTTTTASQTLGNTTTAMGIGSADGSAATTTFAGSLSQVAIWDRALTSTEVTALYTAGTTAPVFPAYDLIGRGDVLLGRRVLVLADYLTDTDEPLFSGRITQLEQDPVTLDLSVVCGDDFETVTNDIPDWPTIEATYREFRMDLVRRVQTGVTTYSTNNAARNPNGGVSRSYWTTVPVNPVSNPSFETNTTGWNTTTDSMNAVAATSVTRTSGSGKHGSYRGVVVSGGSSGISGIYIDLSAYTFLSGVTYRYRAWVRADYSPAFIPGAAIYSNGTFTDKSTVSAAGVGASTWMELAGTWTPSANRSDVHLWVGGTQSYGTFTIDVDAVAVWTVNSNEGAWYDLSFADPLGLTTTATGVTTVSRQTGTGPYGLGTYLRGSASSGAAIAMPFQLPGAWSGSAPTALETFAAGAWRATAWLKGAGTGRLRLGRQSDPSGSASSSTVTLSSTWQQVYVSYTVSGTPTDIWLVAESTGATIDVGGVVVAPGSTTWDWCPTVGMDGFDSDEDAYHVCRITPSGRPIEVLRTLNAASFTRHWCQPLAAYPWWRYRSRALSSLTGKTVAETYDDDVSGYTGMKQLYDSLINVVRWTTGTNYFSGGVFTTAAAGETDEATDATSVALWGRVATDISSEYLEYGSTAGDDIAGYILDTYAKQRARFSFVVENRWPSQLLRELDELVVLNLPRVGIVNGQFIIVGIRHEIGANGRHWRTTYQVEQAPPP